MEVCFWFRNVTLPVSNVTLQSGWFPDDEPVEYLDDSEWGYRHQTVEVHSDCFQCAAAHAPVQDWTWHSVLRPVLDCGCILSDQDHCLRWPTRRSSHPFESAETCVQTQVREAQAAIARDLKLPDYTKPTNIDFGSLDISAEQGVHFHGPVSIHGARLDNDDFLEFVHNFEYYHKLFLYLERIHPDIVPYLPKKMSLFEQRQTCMGDIGERIKHLPSYMFHNMIQWAESICD